MSPLVFLLLILAALCGSAAVAGESTVAIVLGMTAILGVAAIQWDRHFNRR